MSLTSALATQAVADGVLYQAGFADGVASVQPGGISAAQEAQDIATAVSTATGPLASQITALGLQLSTETALLASVQAAAAALVALLNPAPVVPPVGA